MISRAGQANFFVAHYDWIVSGVGLLALRRVRVSRLKAAGSRVA